MARIGIGVGDVIADRFELTGEIGDGGMGRVFEGVDRAYDRSAAVKVIRRDLARDDEFRRRFERESLAAEHANHPHVLPVWDHGVHGEHLYLVTPLCDTDLSALVEERNGIGGREALDILGQVAWALDWAHSRGVIHRDIKPANILLVTGPAMPHAYLADFGLARVSDSETLTRVGDAVGFSPAFAAPEQWEGQRVGAAADRYAFAATLFCALEGRPPFHGRRGGDLELAHLLESPPALRGGPDALDAVLRRGLAKHPDDRYETCGAFIRDARAALEADAPADALTAAPDPKATTQPEHPDLRQRRSRTRRAPPAAPMATAAPEAAAARAAGSTRGETSVVAPPPGPVRSAVPPARTSGPHAGSAPGRSSPSRVTAVARRHKALMAVVAGGLVAVLAAAAALSLAGGGGQRDGATAAPGVPTLAIGPGTAETVAFADRIWLGSVNGTLTVVDPASRQITQRFDRALPDVTRIAGRGDTAWIGSTGNRLRAFSASAGRPLGPAADAGANVYDLAVTMDALWVADGTRGLVERIRLSRPGVLGARRSVATAAGVSALAVGGAVVWALSPDTGRLFALQAATGAVTRNVRVGVGADALAVAGRDVWVANREAGQLVRVDARSGRVAARRRLPSDRSAVVADGDQAYLIDFAGRRASAIGSSGSLTPVATWKAEAGEAAITGHRLLLTSRESPRATLISLDT